MKKKVLSAVLAASMCMSFLAGCGNSGSGDSGSSQSGETSKEASKEADTSAAEKGDGERFPLPSALASSLRLWIRAFPRRQSIGMPWLICMPVCIKN